MHITDIIIPERFRSNYDNIEELACSIAQHGLFNAIILTQNLDLNQGGRRLSAMRLIYEVAEGNGVELNLKEDSIATINAGGEASFEFPFWNGRLELDMIIDLDNDWAEFYYYDYVE